MAEREPILSSDATSATIQAVTTEQAARADGVEQTAQEQVAPRVQGAAFDDDTWWREGVVYQVYPRSFADSDGDGMGDLPGIIAHLDHLNDGSPGSLGVDAIWLSPIYPSPGLDAGYDVSDYSAIDPRFGTMADFTRLVSEAHRRGMRIILDLVMNHTSDAHPWFAESRSSRTNSKADWYLWGDPAGFDRRGRPRRPNNWVSYFGGPAWTWDERRGQFYMHTFLRQQPDLNWRNPAVRDEMWAIVRGWLDRGVDGFRLDVFNAFFKAESLASNPRRWLGGRRPYERQVHRFDKNQPELLNALRDFRGILDRAGGRMSVGELFEGTPKDAAGYTAPRHLVFDFSLIRQPWSAGAFGRAIEVRETAFGPDRWPTVVFSNHDQPRHVSRFAGRLAARDPVLLDAIARAAAVLELTLRGTPFLYYGEEIGLPDVAIPRAEIVDPPARRATLCSPWWNRDQARAPMPWSPDINGGFTTGQPWLRLAPGTTGTRNVASQASDPNSVLAFYRRLIWLRRQTRVLRVGSIRRLPSRDRNVLVYERRADEERAVVAINFGRRVAQMIVPGGDDGRPRTWRVRLSTHGPEPPVGAGGQRMLRPLEAVILEPA
jgi:alpha-glucosidase